MQRLCGMYFTSPKPIFMVELICHKIAVEMIIEPFGEGFSFGKSADHLQQFYGLIFFRHYSPVTLISEEGTNQV